MLNNSEDEDDADDDEGDESTLDATRSTRCWDCCTSKTCCTLYSVLIGAALAVTAFFVAVEHEDTLFASVPLWRWIALGSISVQGQVLARLLYWLFQTGLSRLNHFFEYYTLSTELRDSGKRWFHIVVQALAIASLLHVYPEDNEVWRVAFQWVMRAFSWLLMLQSSTILIGIVSRCACHARPLCTAACSHLVCSCAFNSESTCASLRLQMMKGSAPSFKAKHSLTKWNRLLQTSTLCAA